MQELLVPREQQFDVGSHHHDVVVSHNVGGRAQRHDILAHKQLQRRHVAGLGVQQLFHEFVARRQAWVGCVRSKKGSSARRSPFRPGATSFALPVSGVIAPIRVRPLNDFTFFCGGGFRSCVIAPMSREKEKKDPPNVDVLVGRVEEIIGTARSREEIRKELKLRNNNVHLTASAFLDSA